MSMVPAPRRRSSRTPSHARTSLLGGRTWRRAAAVIVTCAVASTGTVTTAFAVEPAPASQTITVVMPDDMYESDTQPWINATSTSGLDVLVESLTPDVCFVYYDWWAAHLRREPFVAPRAPGTCTVRATQAGNADDDTADVVYEAATPVERSFTIKPDRLEQDMVFEYPVDMRLGDAPQALTATVGTGLPITFESRTPSVCSVQPGTATVAALTPGVCKVQANQAGGFIGVDEYWSTFRRHEFTVRARQGQQTVTLNVPGSIRVGDPDWGLDISNSSPLAAAVVSDTHDVCTVEWPDTGSGFAVRAVAPGTCILRAWANAGTVGTGGATTDYPAVPYFTKTIEVRATLGGSQTVTFDRLATTMRAGTTQVRSATSSTGLPVVVTTSTPSVCTTGSADPAAHGPNQYVVTAIASGTCVVTATQAGGVVGTGPTALEYTAASVTREVTVEAAPVPPRVTQTIKARGANGVALSARTSAVRFAATSGLPVKVTSRTPTVCTVRDGGVRLRGAGTCRLRASAPGNAAYLPAADVEASFRVWAAPKLPKRAKATRVLDVLGRGEGALRVEASPATVCAPVAGGKVALLGAGRCRITVVDPSAAGRTVRSATVRVTAP